MKMKKTVKAEKETVTKMDGQHQEGMISQQKPDMESRKAHPWKDEIREALKIIFELQLEILKLDDPLSLLNQTAFWVDRLTAKNFDPSEFHRINEQYSMIMCTLDLRNKKHQRKKRTSRPVGRSTRTAMPARPARNRREARRRP
jgi:hypothetical protein